MALIWLVALLGWTGVRMLPDRYVSTARIYADADAVLGMLLRGIAMDNSPAAQVEVLQRTLSWPPQPRKAGGPLRAFPTRRRRRRPREDHRYAGPRPPLRQPSPQPVHR